MTNATIIDFTTRRTEILSRGAAAGYESNDAYTHRRSLESKSKPSPDPYCGDCGQGSPITSHIEKKPRCAVCTVKWYEAQPKVKYISCAETARLIRADLKKSFPGIKFWVRSSVYSMGASIRVKWVEGPASDEVRKVADSYAGADFDGMVDLKTHRDHWMLPDGTVTLAVAQGSGASIQEQRFPKPHPDAVKVSFGADYIFCDRMKKDEA